MQRNCPLLQFSRISNQDKAKFILGTKEGLKHNLENLINSVHI